MRALIVTNMYPSPAHPALGSFVADQVAALRRLHDPELALEVFAFAPGGAGAYVNAARRLRGRYGAGDAFDVVHAHFGLTSWPAFAVPAHRRAVTLHGTDLAGKADTGDNIEVLSADNLGKVAGYDQPYSTFTAAPRGSACRPAGCGYRHQTCSTARSVPCV